MLHALLVDDDPSSGSCLAQWIENEGFSTVTADCLGAARATIRRQTPDVVLIDLVLPDGNGLDLLADLESESRVDVVVITGHASVDTAVHALRLGAVDYLTKPIDFARLKAILANVSRSRALRAEIGSLRSELRKLGRFGLLRGTSAVMQQVYDLISRVAPTNASVLLCGASGTGKDLAAQTVHQMSRRSKALFLPVNCGAISPNLIESELFGHEKGSFTGADRVHKGHFERASGGTIFLDEITEMPIELQVKLLRVLETETVIRVGGDAQIPVDVRVIAATNRDPEEAVAAGRLREDLLYRLRVFPIEMPSLAERGDDVVFLAEHFLDSINQVEEAKKSFTPAAIEKLLAHDWPGNVRELKNVVHRSFIMAPGDIDADALPNFAGMARRRASAEAAPAGGNAADAATPAQRKSAAAEAAEGGVRFRVGTRLDEVERRLILATLEQTGGSRKATAAKLGISLKTLYNRLTQYKIESLVPPDNPIE